jgi:sec-independent protein translocase protein TatC
MFTHTPQRTQTLANHLAELRKRLVIIALVFIVAAIVAYQFHAQIISVLQVPLNETLYFSAPGGGFNFVLKVCMLVAFMVASPVIILQIVRFIEPVLPPNGRLALVRYMGASVLLLIVGVTFAYFVTLPAALHFLANFGGENVQSLISANEYMNFVMAYLVGFGLLFQIPVIILFINRIKPIPPRTLLKASRPVIIGAFIMAAILTPTADPANQGLMAGPIIGMYGLSTAMVMVSSGRHKRSASKQMRRSKQVQFTRPNEAPLVSATPSFTSLPENPFVPPRPAENTEPVSTLNTPQQPVLRQYLDLQPPRASHASAFHQSAPQPLQAVTVPTPPTPPTPSPLITNHHRSGPIFMDIRPA